MARSGHTANLVGTRVVITGGILRDGSLFVDIVVVDLATLTVSRWGPGTGNCCCFLKPMSASCSLFFYVVCRAQCSFKFLCLSRPDMGGSAPSTRFRHTLAPIRVGAGTLLEDQLMDALGPSNKLIDGELLFCFGGYNTIGEEFGADSQYVSLTPVHEHAFIACGRCSFSASGTL